MSKNTLASLEVSYPVQYTALKWILKERNKQVEKWGIQSHSMPEWITILLEELGEISKHWLDNRDDVGKIDTVKYLEELTQAAAVIIAWLEDEIMSIHEIDQIE